MKEETRQAIKDIHENFDNLIAENTELKKNVEFWKKAYREKK